MATAAGGVLISYAHEDDRHLAVVRRFAELLGEHGVRVELDRFAAVERQDWAAWTLDAIRRASRVLIIVSAGYRARFEGTGPVEVGRGVQFEGLIIREEIYRDHRSGLRKFVPVLLPGADLDYIPTLLLPYSGTHFRVPELSSDGVAEIADLLHRPLDAAPVRELGELPTPVAGSTAAIHLHVSDGASDDADAVVRLLLAAGAVPLFGADTGSTGARLVGAPETVLDVLDQARRAVHERARSARHGIRLRVGLGGHVTDDGPECAARVAEALAGGDAASRMHAVPDADTVIAVSDPLHDLLRARDPRRPDPFRRYPGTGPDGTASWLAIGGRTTPPSRLPDVAPPGPGEDATAAAAPAPPPTMPVTAGRDINGTVQQNARDGVLNVVQHFGPAR